MKVQPTPISGCFQMRLAVHEDTRGYFARVYDEVVFQKHGLATDFCQTSVAYNTRKGTLRGLHWQTEPYEEAKLVRCIRGAIYDVVVDLRRGSRSFKQWYAFQLNQGGDAQLYVPKGCAHGYQTLADETEVLYQINAPYVPEAACGLRWDDPSFRFDWPLPISEISDRDRSYRDYTA